MGKKLFTAMLLAALVLISGCVGSNPEDIAKTSPLVRQFLSDYPNAEVRITFFNTSESRSILDIITADCNKPEVQAKDFYRVNITDTNSGLFAVAWIDWKNKIVECAVKYNVNGVPQETDTEAETDCNRLKEEITALINQANYCTADSDCKIVHEWYCYQIVNKNADLTALKAKIREYNGDSPGTSCPVMQVMCKPTPSEEDIRCVNSRCVESGDYTDCDYLESQVEQETISVKQCSNASECVFNESFTSCYNVCGMAHNKNSNLSSLRNLLDRYDSSCTTGCPAQGCPDPSTLVYVCIDSQCDAKQESDICRNDEDCGEGYSCWAKMPAGAEAGVPGSEENPGICRKM